MFEQNKTHWISYALHMLLKQVPLLHIRPHNTARSFILRQWKKLPFYINFCSHLIGSFQNVSEQI